MATFVPWLRRWAALALALGAAAAQAVVTVNPNGVNVRANGPTTVFLTFQGLDANEVPLEAFWCGAVQPGVVGGAVTSSDPCVPGTLYGRLPLRHAQVRNSSSGGVANLTDIMTIPATVARRAYQDAAAGQASDFFYVRRFAGGVGGDRFVVVTCRMSAAGARTPLALLDVRLQFEGAAGRSVLPAVARGGALPRFAARILYNGTGELRGRWELVQPGDPEPTEDDLLTEATLPPEQRGAQRRWRLIERFQVFVPPGGELTIAGPDPQRIALDADGAYKLLLRVEASDDKEGLSNTGAGRLAASGGVAGFALPVLRFHVGTAAAAAASVAPAASAGLPDASGRIELLAPGVAADPPADLPLRFSWADVPGAALYRLDLQGDGKTLLAAFIKPGLEQFLAPGFVAAQRALQRRWRVVALDAAGQTLAESEWRALAGRP